MAFQKVTTREIWKMRAHLHHVPHSSNSSFSASFGKNNDGSMDKICQHEQWHEIFQSHRPLYANGPCLVDCKGRNHTEHCYNTSKLDFRHLNRQEICVFAHQGRCPNFGDPHGRLCRTALQQVRHCIYCFTDYQVDVVTVPDPFLFGVRFTTWKDLGSGNCVGDFAWQSHQGIPYTRRNPAMWRVDKGATFSEEFEGDLKAKRPISQRNLNRIEEIEACSNNMINDVLVGHQPRSKLGLIPNPDPLDELVVFGAGSQ